MTASHDTGSGKSERTCWPVALLGVGISSFGAFLQFKLPPVLPAFLAAYPHSPTTAAWFMSVFALVGLLASAPLGRLVERHVLARALALGLAIAAAGIVIGLLAPQSGPLMLLGRGLEGLTFAIFAVIGPVIANSAASRCDLGLVTGLIAAWIPIGQLLAGPLALGGAVWGAPWGLNLALMVPLASLADAMALACKIAPKRHNLPILANVLMRDHGGAVMLEATDLDLTARITLADATADAGFAATVPAHTLRDAVKIAAGDRKRLAGAEVTIAAGGDGATVLASGARASLPTLDVADWPEMKIEGEIRADFTIPRAAMLAALESVHHAISTEATRYYLRGAFLHVHRESDVAMALRFVGGAVQELQEQQLLPLDAADIPDWLADLAGNSTWEALGLQLALLALAAATVAWTKWRSEKVVQ